MVAQIIHFARAREKRGHGAASENIDRALTAHAVATLTCRRCAATQTVAVPALRAVSFACVVCALPMRFDAATGDVRVASNDRSLRQ